MRYREFRPTAFDGHINIDYDEETREDWIVHPCGQNRDSEALTRSNFETATRLLDDDNLEYECHSFGHWANGWFEIILVEPTEEGIAHVEEIEGCLENYAVLDDEDYTEKEQEDMQKTWEWMSMRDRIGMCVEEGLSMFSARNDYPPSEIESWKLLGC